MFGNNTGGYQSGQPLNLNNNTNLFYNPGTNIFGGNNNNMLFNNAAMISPNANVQQWITESANNVLINLVNNGRLTTMQANYVLDRINNNINTFYPTIARATNNFTNCHPNIVTEVIAQIIQFIINEKQKEEQRNAMMTNSAMNNAAYMANAAGSFNGNYNVANGPAMPINPIANQTVYNGTKPRKAKYPIGGNNQQQQIQNYANASAIPANTGNQSVSTTNDTNNATSGINTIDPTKYINARMHKAKTYMTDSTYESPIQLKHTKIKQFDPKDKSSWPIELIDAYMHIETLNVTDNLKQYLAKCALNETYWKSKGIKWNFDESFGLSTAVKEKYQERKNLPVSKIASTTEHVGYEVKVDDELFMNCSTDNALTITFASNSNPVANVVTTFMSTNNIVPNEKEFIDECTNGQIVDAVLTKNGEPTINISKAQNVAFIIDYDVTKMIDIPYELFADYYKNLFEICKKYKKNYSDKFKEFINEFTEYLYSIPRKWSERIDKFIISILNEAADRSMKNMIKGIAQAPYFNSFINVKDIMDGNEYNFLASDKNFTVKFALFIYQVLLGSFTGMTLNPEVNEDINVIVDTQHGRELLTKYYGSDVTYEDITEWKNDTETFDTKFEHLKKRLKMFSVVAINKSIMITDIIPDIKYVKDANVWCMYPSDDHLDIFEQLIAISFNKGGYIHDAIIINNKTKTALTKPINGYFKLGYTFDKYVGRMRIDQ